MKLSRPAAPFERVELHGESFTLDTSGKVLVLPTANAAILPSFNQSVLDSNRLTIAESPFGGLKGAGSPDYCPGTLFCQTDGVYLTDTSGTNPTKTLTAGTLADVNGLTVNTSEKFYFGNRLLNNLAVVAPYDQTISYDVPGYGGETSLEIINLGKNSRIRQAGDIKKIKFGIANTSEITDIRLKIWRKINSTYTVIAISENLTTSLTDGTNEITLSTPIHAFPGDCYGINITQTGASKLLQSTPVVGGSIKYLTSQNYQVGESNTWDSPAGSETNKQITVLLYMDSPDVVCIGDSICSGRPANYSFIESTPTTNLQSSFSYYFDNITFQNMGISGQSTTQIKTRFADDVVAASPGVAIIEGGVNDVAQDDTTNTIANYENMIIQCLDNGIVPIIILILPWNAGTDSQREQVDTLNIGLIALANEHNVEYIDMRDDLGSIINGKWTVDAAYDADGIHYTEAGYAKMGSVIYPIINQYPHSITSDFIIVNMSSSNTPLIIDDCSSASGWSVYTGTGTISVIDGKIHVDGVTSATGSLLITKTINQDLSDYSLFSFDILSSQNASAYYLLGTNTSNCINLINAKSYFSLVANTQSKIISAIKAPISTSNNANPTYTVGTVNWSSVPMLLIGVRAAGNSTAITLDIDNIVADILKPAYVEFSVPDTLGNYSAQLKSFDGVYYNTYAVDSLKSTYSNLLTDETKFQYLDGTLVTDVSADSYDVFPTGVSGATVNGSTGTMTYSANQGTSKRIGLRVDLPPSDGGRTNFNKIRLKTILTYAPDAEDNYSASYDFADSTNTSYGLQNLSKPWIALYSPTDSLIDFYLFTHRPKNLSFKRNDDGTIHEVTLYPGNGLIYHGQITYANLTADSNSDGIPDCLEASVEGSLTKFLQAYGMVI